MTTHQATAINLHMEEERPAPTVQNPPAATARDRIDAIINTFMANRYEELDVVFAMALDNAGIEHTPQVDQVYERISQIPLGELCDTYGVSRGNLPNNWRFVFATALQTEIQSDAARRHYNYSLDDVFVNPYRK